MALNDRASVLRYHSHLPWYHIIIPRHRENIMYPKKIDGVAQLVQNHSINGPPETEGLYKSRHGIFHGHTDFVRVKFHLPAIFKTLLSYFLVQSRKNGETWI